MTAADAAAARTAIGAGTSSFSGAYSALSGIPSTFAPSAHKTSHATGGIDALTAADIGAAATSHAHAASDITSGIIGTARLATGTADSTTYLRGDQTWQTVTAGVGGSTGSVDNAVLRADGTGGSTVQSSSIVIADNYTASPNNTVNHASIQAIGGTTNVSVSIVPKGTGAFCLAVPDGTTTGGNTRGANAIDLQITRSAATQVASGSSAVCLGASCTASGTSGVSIGTTANAGGNNGIAIGSSVTGGGTNSIVIGSEGASAGNSSGIAIGTGTTASTYACMAVGRGAVANTSSKYAQAFGSFAANGDLQFVRWILANKTTDATPTTLFCRTVFSTTDRATITSGKIMLADVLISGIKSDGSASACYKRKIAIKNVGGTTTLVGSVDVIGVDQEDNALTDVVITADNTNDALQISVTGIASETWRWVAVVEGLEIAYGT